MELRKFFLRTLYYLHFPFIIFSLFFSLIYFLSFILKDKLGELQEPFFIFGPLLLSYLTIPLFYLRGSIHSYPQRLEENWYPQTVKGMILFFVFPFYFVFLLVKEKFFSKSNREDSEKDDKYERVRIRNLNVSNENLKTNHEKDATFDFSISLEDLLERQSEELPTSDKKPFDNVKLKEENYLYSALETNTSLVRLRPFVEERVPDEDLSGYLKYLLRSSVELSEKSYPALFKILENLKQEFQLDISPRVFKMNHSGFENAFISAKDKEVVLGFTGNILSLLDDEKELKSIIGHELGHYIFRHHDHSYLTYLLSVYRRDFLEDLNELEQELIFSKEGKALLEVASIVSQIQELNADRMGLLAGKDFESSARAFLKLSAGKVDSFGTYSIDDYLQQANQLMKEKDYFSEEDLLQTHPIPPLRVKALEYFYHTDTFMKAQKKEYKYSIKQVNKMLPLFVPMDYLPIKNSNREKALKNKSSYEYQLFLVYSVFWVIIADNKLDSSEANFIEFVLNKYATDENVAREVKGMLSGINRETLQNAMENLFLPVSKESSHRKEKLIDVLFMTAKIDGNLVQEEIFEISSIARKINATKEYEKVIKNHLGKNFQL